MMLWGWRVAFLIGALTGVVGVFLRRKMPDPAVFLARKEQIEQEIEAEQAADPNNQSHHVPPYRHEATEPASLKDVDTILATPVATSGVISSAGSADNMVVVEEGRAAPDAKDVAAGSPAAGKKRVRYWPVLNMLKNYRVPVLLQFTWEFWFAGAWMGGPGIAIDLVSLQVLLVLVMFQSACVIGMTVL
jgi:hypothetical protein